MSRKSVKLQIDTTLLARVRAAVGDGHADSLDAAAESAFRGWLRSVGSSGADDLDLDFEDYAALLVRDRVSTLHGHEIDVIGENSYVTEIEYAQDAFREYGTFANLPLDARERVSGFGSSNGYLGRNEGAAKFKPVVRKNPVLIGDHLDKLPLAGPVTNELTREVVTGLCAVPGVGLACASRLLAVKRPDLFVPVNKANRAEVVRRFGRVRTLPAPAAEDYLGLIERIHEYPWFKAKPPPRSDVDDRTVWEFRVALLDALLYAPEEADGEE